MVIGNYLVCKGRPYQRYVLHNGLVYRKLFLFLWVCISSRRSYDPV